MLPGGRILPGCCGPAAYLYGACPSESAISGASRPPYTKSPYLNPPPDTELGGFDAYFTGATRMDEDYICKTQTDIHNLFPDDAVLLQNRAVDDQEKALPDLTIWTRS
jgi:hypothetical protein